nr:TonB-dependent receptor [Sphingomonas bacterium]
MSIQRTSFLASTALLAALTASPGASQTAASAGSAVPQDSAANAGDSGDNGELEDIVVTARKREESLNSVPLAVTAITSGLIERAGITSIQGLNAIVPSFSQVPAQDPGTNIITVRGITQVRFGEPPVALVIDGVQASSPDQGTQELTDIERIEVLRGPQGSTYGRNAIGGAINITTRLPTNELENQLSAEIGQGLYYRLFGASSGAIVDDTLLYRMSASYTNNEGRIRNETLDRKVDNYESISLRGRLIYKPTAALSLDLRGSYENLNGGSAYYYPLFPGQDINAVYPVVSNRGGKGERRLRDSSLKADYNFANGMTLTSISAYAYARAATLGQDLDFLSYPLAPGFGGLILDQNRRTESWSEEVRLTSPSDGRLRWLLGAYYLNTHRDVVSSAYLDLGPGSDIRTVRLSNLPERNRNNAYAVFGTLDYDFSESLKLSLGLRQDWDDRKQANPATGSRVGRTFESLQPKASLSYFFTPDQMVYASAARGFRSGGFNAESLIFPRQYDAEIADTYEIGSKLSLVDRRLQLNVAGFYTDQKNVQFYRWDSASAAQGILTINDGYHYGIEGDLTARLTRELRVSLGGSLIDSKIQDYNGAALYRGNKLPHVNGWKYNVGVQYDRDLGGGIDGGLRIDYQAFGDLYWFIDNLEKQKQVDLVSARILINRAPWSLTLSAENVFNRRYNTDYFSSFFAGSPTDVGFPNPPRQLNAKLAVRF